MTGVNIILRPIGYLVRGVWAVLLIVFGLSMMSASGRGMDETMWFGVAFFGAGQFLSMDLVANRLCPPRSPGLAIVCEMLAAVVFLGALLVGCLMFVVGVLR